MTLQATLVDMTSKVGCAILVARAVDPLLPLRPITHWQLIQLIAGPVEISLATHPGTDHNVNSLPAGKFLLTAFRDGSLIIAAIVCIHLEVKTGISIARFRICNHEDILPIFE